MLNTTNIISSLLLFIPVSIAGHFLGWESSTIFITSALAIIPLAAWMGTATEEIAVVLGANLGGLLNATFRKCYGIDYRHRRPQRRIDRCCQGQHHRFNYEQPAASDGICDAAGRVALQRTRISADSRPVERFSDELSRDCDFGADGQLRPPLLASLQKLCRTSLALLL